MALIEWDNSLSVGHSEIDAQHRTWIQMINELHEALVSGGSEKLKQIKHESLTAIMDYTDYHFKFEEQFMEEIGYPDIVAHKQAHSRFKYKIFKILCNAQNGYQPLNTQLMSLMKNWLKGHIQFEDIHIGLYTAGLQQATVHEAVYSALRP